MESKLSPPDGGWGWVVAFALGLNNIVMVPLITGLGLVFKEFFFNFHLSPTDTVLILNVNMSFGMSMGLIHGPLLKRFGCRKIAVAGGICFSLGLILTSISTQFIHFLIFYGFIASFGVGLSMAACYLALNMYFSVNKEKAFAVAMSLSGLGPIVMPQVISLLKKYYSNQSTILFLGGITLHSIVAALLLQPVEWHSKRTVNEPRDKIDDTNDDKCADQFKLIDVKSIEIAELEEEKDQLIIPNSFLMNKTNNISHSQSICNIPDDLTANKNDVNHRHNRCKASGKSLESINLGSCLLFDESIIPVKLSPIDDEMYKEVQQNGIKVTTPKTPAKNCWGKIVDFFDLTLLCDPIYVNIMLGIAIATFSETTFTLLTPYILQDVGFSVDNTAFVMSMIGLIDLLTRGLTPAISKWLKKTPRTMYLISLVMLIGNRSILLVWSSMVSTCLMAVGLGFARGFKSVFMSLVVPSHVPLERLGHATGIQTVVNGAILMAGGPVMGKIKEIKGSFVPCIILINIMTLITIIMWIIEMYLIGKVPRKKCERY